MKNQRKWFTLVELLVSITILAIVSVVAYQSFGWVTGKAQNARKTQDISTIETSLNTIFAEKNYYPAVWVYDANKDAFGYNSGANAQQSNSFAVEKEWVEVKSVSNIKWGWRVIWLWEYASKQIWAKWTISQTSLGKEYLTKDLYDIEIGDTPIKSGGKMIDKWIGRYVYAVYNRGLSNWNWTSNLTWTAYNIAVSYKQDNSEDYYTKITWTYTKSICNKETNCPETLIWSASNTLRDGQVIWKTADNKDLSNMDSTQTNQWIPYPVKNF